MGTTTKLTFADCLHAAVDQEGLIEDYDRLRGTNLCRRGSPLDLAIDDAAGRTDAEVAGFIEFVHDAIWGRLPPEIRDTGGGPP
jgi:hypothetical protein